MSQDRRDFLRLLGGGATAGLMSGCARFRQSGAGSSAERAPDANFIADVELAIKASPAEKQPLPGARTSVWSYQGEVLRGEQSLLQPSPDSYLGPTLRLRKGQKVRLRFTNNLPESSIIHWHGLHVPAAMDGHPSTVVEAGQTYLYEFEVANRAGTYWYHPHPHERTGPQVYRGLAGLLLIADDEEAGAGLPGGDYDVPLVIQDRTFDGNNQLVYLPGGMMDRMMGFLGERMLVNGRPDFVLPVATRAYRLRLLNGSNSRIYKLAWDDGTPLTVIATDGVLLERPVTRNFVTLAPAERIDLLADFRDRPVGAELELRSLEFTGADTMGRNGMGGGMMGGGGMGAMQGSRRVPNGAPLSILKVRVERKEQEHLTLPATLSAAQHYRMEDAVNSQNPRRLTLTMRGMNWTLNGRTFQMEEVAANEIVRANTLEVWEFVNESGSMGMMGGMSMAHPMHIHGVHFQVIDRQVAAEFAAGHEMLRPGFVDEGWKDTVLVMPGEQVKLLVKFENYPGLFLYHCHNLEHEDLGMMRNYQLRG